jgi:hypothetical protein
MLLALLTACGAPVRAENPADNWHPAEKFKECLEQAAAKDVPLVIIYQGRAGEQSGRVSTYMAVQNIDGMLRVRVHDDAPPEGLAQIDQATYHTALPVMLFSDGEGHTIGYVSAVTLPTDIRDVVKQATAVMAWKRKTRAALAAAEKLLEGRGLVQVQRQIDLIARQDLTYSTAVMAALDRANKLAGQSPEVKAPAVTEGMFFTAKIAELRAKVDEQLTTKLAEIETLLAQNELDRAWWALLPLTLTRFGEAGDAKVKVVDLKVRAAMAKANQAAKDAANNSSAPKPAGSSPAATEPNAKKSVAPPNPANP